MDASGRDITEASHIGTLNPYRYRGYYYDTETGLYYLQTRYYDPEIGRFMTIDAIEYVSADPMSGHNLYAYCGNNPVMRTDPEGTAWWHWLIGVFLAVATTIAVVATAGTAAVAIGASAAVTQSMCVGAGITAATAGVINLATQASQGNEQFDIASLVGDMLFNGCVGMITGGLGGAIIAFSPAVSTGAKALTHIGMQVGVNTIISAGAYILQNAIKGEEMTLLGLGVSVFSGVVSGLTYKLPFIKGSLLAIGLELAGYGADLIEMIKRALKRN